MATTSNLPVALCMTMNPFTRFLAQWNRQSDLTPFIACWDTLEALAIRIYKQGQATAEDERIYAENKRWLEKNYPHWQEKLKPYWEGTLVGGTAEHADPFLFLIEGEDANSLVGNWAALQHLPAGREALNALLVAQDPSAQP